MRLKKAKDKRPPIFLDGRDHADDVQRAHLLRKQSWRCATCNGVCTGALKLLGKEVVHMRCYVEQLRVELRETE